MNFSIGLNGLKVAQTAIEVTGTNIANAGTEGYHRQRVEVVPLESQNELGLVVGGAKVKDVTRIADRLLEKEIRRQNPAMGQLTQELQSLLQVESSFGTLGEEPLGKAINEFFAAARELSAQPTGRPLQEQFVWAADAMTGQFQNAASFISELDSNIRIEAEQIAAQVNDYTQEIADLNGQIAPLEMTGSSANLLIDRRDAALEKLAELLPVTAVDQQNQLGVVNVSAWGMPLVTSNTSLEIETGTITGNELGVSVKNAGYYRTNYTGGKLGAMIALKNTLLPSITAQLDGMAAEIARQVNGYHVQGIGTAGSFTSLRRTVFGESTDTLGSLSSDIAAGDFYIRVTDIVNGTSEYEMVTVDPADTLGDVVAAIDALDHMTAAVAGSQLSVAIEPADVAQYRFDFLPVSAVTSLPGGSTAVPAVEGVYTAASNETFTVTVAAAGAQQVGVDNITLAVRNSASELVKTLNVGSGYAAGDRIEITDGLYLTVTTGTLQDAATFTIRAQAESDTSGLLAAAGINTFFAGSEAATIAVRDEVFADSERIATMLGPNMDDNLNMTRIAELSEATHAALNNTTFDGAFRSMIVDLGQKVTTRESRRTSLENILQQLNMRRDEISGVDINDEAASLLAFEQMFQAMARVITVQQQVMDHLMNIL